ncbi:helix-turn-helix domain-containing protein [Alteribacillus sp. HJP-4]|uniref:helix-turn-helix domain-containing protein n=1 Tax=Alteribacillus sp. HJP-4 TaxID=2775394 RepID=UPI0035CCFA41
MNSLREYETFKTVSDVDSFASNALSYFALNKTERELLWLLAGHSVKFVGVSFLKLSSIAEALKVSKRTVQRALKLLIEYGVIKRVRTLRPVKGGFGASITIICPLELSTRDEAIEPTSEPSHKEENKKETFPFKSFSKDIQYLRHQNEIIYSYLTEFVPEEFIKAAKPFFNAEEVFSLWGKVHACSRRYAPKVLNIIEPAIIAFKVSVLSYKKERIKQSFGAYFWVALSGVLTIEQRKTVNNDSLSLSR